MPADLILLNGPIITVDERRPMAEAVAVQAGRITRVGSAAEVREEQGPATRVVDLGGRTLLPGLNDNHNHPMSLGQTLRSIDASPGATPTLAALQEAFRRAASQSGGRDGWLVARGMTIRGSTSIVIRRGTNWTRRRMGGRRCWSALVATWRLPTRRR